MANVIFTSNTDGGFTVTVDGVVQGKARDVLEPRTSAGSKVCTIVNTKGFNQSDVFLTLNADTDTININGVTTFLTGQDIYNELMKIFFLVNWVALLAPVAFSGDMNDVTVVGTKAAGNMIFDNGSGGYIERQALISDISGLQSELDSKVIGLESLIVGVSPLANQLPTGLDAPMKISFGAAQTTPAVSLSSTGDITFNITDTYFIDIRLQFGRSTNMGDLESYFNILRNGVPISISKFVKIDNNKSSVPILENLYYGFNAGDVVSFEVVRDSAGVNEGGLYSFTPTLAGRPVAPTAAIEISRYQRA